MNSKQILDYYDVSESFFCTVFRNVIAMYTMQTLELFWASQLLSKAPLDPQVIITMPSALICGKN